jgi:protein-disulfide isomerase
LGIQLATLKQGGFRERELFVIDAYGMIRSSPDVNPVADGVIDAMEALDAKESGGNMAQAKIARARLAVPVSEERDHIRGPSAAPVTLVEYGDYECLYCGQAYYVLKELESRAGNLIRFVFRNFPLTTIHPHAERAAEAAEAAGAQGKFWETHDRLYENQQSLEDEDLLESGVLKGLDIHRIAREIHEGRYLTRIREDFLSGARSGVNGTPTFFINGARHDGSWDLATLMAAIEKAAGRRRD